MPHQHRHRHRSNGGIAQAQRVLQRARQKHRHQAFERIAQQRERRRFFLAAAQYIGGTGVARAVAARVGHAVKFRHNHGKRERAD